MGDVMLFGVLRMPYDMAMADEFTRYQYHQRGLQAADAIEALQAQLAEARDKALEDAARMVDCACECREAVLTANTRVERWTACGRDPCGALDAADIRAMKGEGG